MERIIFVLTAMIFVGVLLLSCSAGSAPQGFSDQVLNTRTVQAGGMPFGDVHELHDGPDEDGNRFAECLDCHAAHGMSFDWQNVDREYCLACHPEQATNHSSRDCMYCHNTSGGPGNN